MARAGLLILALGLAATAVLLAVRSDERQAPTPGPRFGFNELRWSVAWQGGSDEPLVEAVEASRAAGADTARLVLPWFDVIGPDGGWDEPAWERYRRSYEAMIEHGIEPIVAVLGAPRGAAGEQDDPDWAQPGCTGGFAAPPAPAYDAQWQAVIGRVADEFGQALAIEAWNEPNSPDFWGGCAPDAGRYLELLRAAKRAIAASGHPELTLVSAGLNPAHGEDVVAWRRYLAALVGSGLAGQVGAVGLHPYPAPDDCARPEPALAERLALAVGDQVDEALAIVGEETPIWVTEFGASSAAGSSDDCRALTERGQARALAEMYRELADRDRVEVAIVHQLADEVSSTEELQNHFGVALEDPFLAPKPAYTCLARLREDPDSSCGT